MPTWKMTPPGLPATLRELTKEINKAVAQAGSCRGVPQRIATLAVWVCATIREHDLLIGVNPARAQELRYLPHSGYNCLCQWPGCADAIQIGEPIMWDPSRNNYHVRHYADEVVRLAQSASEQEQLPLELRGIDAI